MNINKFNLDLIIAVDEKDFISINIVLYIEDFSLAMETDVHAESKSAPKAPNVNRSTKIYNGLTSYLSALTHVKFLNFKKLKVIRIARSDSILI